MIRKKQNYKLYSDEKHTICNGLIFAWLVNCELYFGSDESEEYMERILSTDKNI